MTLAEFQPYVEAAVTAYEWATARTRWKQGLLEEREAVAKAWAMGEQYGLDRAPLDARLQQIDRELQQDVTADRVSVLPLRSVPMDLIATAVLRRILQVPAEFQILGVKTLPSPEAIDAAVQAIARNWQHPNRAVVHV